MQKFSLRKEISGYLTNIESTADLALNYLVDGSQNVLIDPRFSKVGSRGGYSRLGAANTALKPVRNKFDWLTSLGEERNLRFYDDELEVYLGTIDGVEIAAWTRVLNSLSTTAIHRACTWWDNTEKLDVMLFVNNDDNTYKWGGGVATIKSATSNTITKNGTATWAENGFFNNGTRKVLIDGTEYTYTGGESTTALTGVTPTPAGESADSVATQAVVTSADTPASGRTNNYIFNFENHIFVGSDTDSLVYFSKSSDYTDFTYSSPRIAGEGGLLTLDGNTKGFSLLTKKPIIFSGEDSIFTVDFTTITVSTTLTEAIKIRKLKNGSRQGAYNQETIIGIGDSIIYLSNEPALRKLETVADADTPQLRALSNPIKPDFDDETWTGACAIWHKNRYYLSAPDSSKLYILDYVETADGRLKRFWQPPQILPVRSLSVIAGALYGHSNATPETYLLFNGTSDGVGVSETINTGATSPQTASNDGSVGTSDWLNVDNIKTSNDSWASADLRAPSTSKYLIGTNYGFAIPTGSTIVGIKVEIEESTGPYGSVENSVKIIKGGTISGDDKSTGATLPTNDAYVTYGSSTDLWGLTWTAEDINLATFGVGFSAVGGIASVDHIRITVYYTKTAQKLPIKAICKFAYRTYGKRANLKTHDEFYVEGNISASTDDLTLTLRYDFGGATQDSVFTIDGTDADILYQSLEETSLGQQPLGTQPIGGSVQEPPELSRFRTIIEMAKEDYHELQEVYESNDVDRSWEIISSGGNTQISPNRNTIISK